MAIVTGTSGNDIGTFALYGTNSADLIYGFAGVDQLAGLDDDDALVGGLGDDLLLGGDGSDLASYAYSEVGVLVLLDENRSGVYGAADDQNALISIENVLGSTRADLLRGTTGANTLNGDDGWDQFFGLGGADRLIGGDGEDTLWGGTAGDVFGFGQGDSASAKANADLIADFSRTQGDKIDLGSFGLSVGVFPPGWNFTFVGAKAFSAEHQVRAIVEGGDTLVGLNVTGTTGAEMWIRLVGEHGLQASDLLL